MVNGHIYKKCNGYDRQKVPPRTIRKQGSMISAVTDAPASGRVVSAGIPDGVQVNGEAAPLPCYSDQMKPEGSHKADAKNNRPWKKFRHKKRIPEVNCAKKPSSPPATPPKQEDWEKEIQEVMMTGWDKMCYGTNPYGPEDLLPFHLRDLTSKQRDMVPPPGLLYYCPAIYHPRPFKWNHYNVPVEPDQFEDADEVPEVNCAKIPSSPPKHEDGEEEIQEVTMTGCSKMTSPYGPEDLLHYDLRGLTLKQQDIVPLPGSFNNCQAIHRPRPFKWTHYSFPVEPDQCADADE
ncbi:uncharacterized protein LOC141810218 [Halichoeres trimaculatus]|uniref:uncharacterized protein LOC141810218 n=1 Tax=Halichoeres trimaculatus TaxID=147232 RepID=UPI003D9E96D2